MMDDGIWNPEGISYYYCSTVYSTGTPVHPAYYYYTTVDYYFQIFKFEKVHGDCCCWHSIHLQYIINFNSQRLFFTFSAVLGITVRPEPEPCQGEKKDNIVVS